MNALTQELKDIGVSIAKQALRQAVANLAQERLVAAYHNFKLRDKVSVYISHKDTMYEVLTDFISNNVNIEDIQSLEATAKTRVPHFSENVAGKVQHEFRVVPNDHDFEVIYKGVKILFEHTEPYDKKSTGGKFVEFRSKSGSGSGYKITVHKKNRKKLIEFLRKAHTNFVKEVRTGPSVYYTRWGTDFYRSSAPSLRSWESVILKDTDRQLLETEVESFFNKEDWYIERGIPYRKGFLLHGPPGTGKTSIVKGLAEKYKLDVYIINFSTSGFDESTLTDLFNDIPTGAIVLFEDIDGLFQQRKEGKDPESSNTKVTFRSFINLLDGIMTPHGILVFMTTNFPTRLDHALMRPGRCDVHLEVGYADKETTKAFWEHFYNQKDLKAIQNLFNQFWEVVKDKEDLTISLLQAYLSRYPESPEMAIMEENFEKHLESFKHLTDNDDS